MRSVGAAGDLLFSFRRSARVQADPCLLWGEASLTIAGQPVWSATSTGGFLEWTWIDLLETLGRNWKWITLEETYPLQLTPGSPARLRADAEQRWQDLSVELRLEEDEALFRFEGRHDLARGLRGLFVPPLFIMREGLIAWLSSDEIQHRMRLTDLVDTLVGIGDLLSSELEEGALDVRAQLALNRWVCRDQVDDLERLTIRLGFDARELAVDSSSVAEFLELASIGEDSPVRDESELLAAARMTAQLPTDEQRRVLDKLRSVAKQSTPALDALSMRACDYLTEAQSERAFDEGHALAEWLRRELGLDGPVDPESLLKSWGVVIREERFDECLDAVACWGRFHGPAIMINTYGRHAHAEHGRRSTLAHEICHLLVDRASALPAAEVFGGLTPERPEKRARAFAAELLLPRDSALHVLVQSPSLDDAVTELMSRYGVGRQIVGWQIRNGPAYARLTPKERQSADRLARGPA